MKKFQKARKSKVLLFFLAAILLFAPCPFTVYAAQEDTDEEEKLLAPYFIIQGAEDQNAAADYFPLKSTDVITNINGVIAETYVIQTYTNEGTVPINARYVFPTSSDVTVHGMEMTIGNQVVTAKIKEKEEAKEEFETAKSEGKSASLLEQKRPNVFTMDVANIMPGDIARINLHYTQLITPTEGIYEFVFPTVVGPRYAAPSVDDTSDSKTDSIASDVYVVNDVISDRYAMSSPENSDGNSDTVPDNNACNDNNSADNQNNDTTGNDHNNNPNDTNNPNTDNDGQSDSENSDQNDSNDTQNDNDNSEQNDCNDSQNDGEGAINVDDNNTVEKENSDNSENDSLENNSNGVVSDDNDWIATPYLPDGVTPSSQYHITVNLSTGVPIADLTCKTHEISVYMDSDSKAQITLSNPEDYAGNRDFILKYKLTGDTVQSGLVLTGGEKENFFMLTVQPPEHYTPAEIPCREYIFVLDVSGSMNGYPLDTAKDLISDMAVGLRRTDKFNLILFANDTILLSEKSLLATDRNIKAALKLVDEQKGGGGTSLLPALKDAINIPKSDNIARSIVIITDGYISNEQEIFDTIEQNMDTASFFPFGIGSGVNEYLIKGIAGTGLGEAFIVTDSEDAEESASRFKTYIESPLLTDITVDFDSFDVYDVAPAIPSILYAQKPIVLFGKWRGTPSGTITISGKSGNEDYTQQIPVSDVTVDMQNDALRYLWARTRLDKIAGFGSTRNDNSTKDEITQLGLEYNMTTPYTSFVAVVDTIRNTEGESQDVDQALPMPQHVTNLAVGGGYTAYSEPGDLLFFLLIPCLSLAGIVKFIKATRKNAKSQPMN